MKVLRIVLKFLLQHKIPNLLLVVELCLSMLVLTMMINRYNESFKYYNAFQGTELADSIYFMGRFTEVIPNDSGLSFTVDRSYEAALMKYLESQPEFIGTSHTMQLSADISQYTSVQEDPGSGYYSLIVLDEKTSQVESTRLQAGHWPKKDEVEDGIIPCVIYKNAAETNDFYIGEIIESSVVFSQFQSSENQYTKELSFKVVGIMNRNALEPLIPLVQGNGAPSLKALFVQQEKYCIYAPYIEDIFGKDDSQCFFIYFSNNITEARYKDIENGLDKFGYHARVSEMMEVTKNEANGKLQSDINTFLALSGISLLGLISISFLNVKRLYRRFSIYYLCGCSYIKSIWLYAVYLSFLVSVAFAGYMAIVNYFFNISDDSTMAPLYFVFDIQNGTGLISLSVCVFVITVCTYVPFAISKKNPRINLFKGN